MYTKNYSNNVCDYNERTSVSDHEGVTLTDAHGFYTKLLGVKGSQLIPYHAVNDTVEETPC